MDNLARYQNLIENKGNVVVAEFEYKKDKGIKIISSIESKTANKEIWNICTNQYQKVSTMMYSPNRWDGNEIGLADCSISADKFDSLEQKLNNLIDKWIEALKNIEGGIGGLPQ